MTLQILSPSGDPQIVAPPIYRSNSFEHCLSYQRIDDMHVQMVITHVPETDGKPTEPMLNIASYRTVRNPNMVPHRMIELSMEEARLLRDFLNRDEVSAYLEGE